MTPLARGAALCLLSQILFGILYLFSHWMRPLSGTDVFAWRMLVTVPALLLLVSQHGGWQSLRDLVHVHLGRRPGRWAMFLLGTLIVGSQFWLFMWAPVNGEGVNTAIGYFLFPLTMALGGRLLLKERLTRLQTVALMLAASGVAHELWATRSFSWTSLWVCLVYPPYYLSRRMMRIPALPGLTLDFVLIMIPSLAYLLWQGDALTLVSGEPRYWWLLAALGAVTAVAMASNLQAGQLLPVGIFAMISYLEPALLFIVAVWVLDTPVADGAYLTYGPIWAGLLLLGLNALRHWKRNRHAGAG